MALPNKSSLSHLESLPDDVFSNILGELSLPDLLHIQQLSSVLSLRVRSLGIPLYLSRHPQNHLTISPPPSSLSKLDIVRHDHFITTSLARRRWHALQVGPTWSQNVIPTLLVTPGSMFLGVGGHLLVHPISSGSAGRAQSYPIAKRFSGSKADIIGVVDLGHDEVGIAQYDGTLQRYKLPEVRSTAHYGHPKESNVHTLAASPDGEVMMTTTSTGLVSVFRTRSPWSPPHTFSLRQPRAWSSMVASDSLFLGVSASIDIHPLLPSGPSAFPSRSLHGPDPPSRSSPYDLARPPSPSVHNPSILLSGWYDSHLRLHDLRLPDLGPVLEMSDPYTWADGSAMYSCAFVAEHHVAGGGARHGTVALFDIRSPKVGWSCFSPEGRGSPVYKLVGEGGRLWGVTEKRAFVLTFDGSGGVSDGVVKREARAVREARKGKERPSGWKGRGGKWNWTVRYGAEAEEEGTTGYEHSQRAVTLFDSLRAAA